MGLGDTIGGFISDVIGGFLKPFEGVEEDLITVEKDVKEVVQDTIAVAQDTERGFYTTVDNARGDVLYTVRDTKSELLTFADATLDNVAIVSDKHLTNLFDTIQMGALIGMGSTMIFLILYGDKLFSHGIRLGRINLL